MSIYVVLTAGCKQSCTLSLCGSWAHYMCRLLRTLSLCTSWAHYMWRLADTFVVCVAGALHVQTIAHAFVVCIVGALHVQTIAHTFSYVMGAVESADYSVYYCLCSGPITRCRQLVHTVLCASFG